MFFEGHCLDVPREFKPFSVDNLIFVQDCMLSNVELIAENMKVIVDGAIEKVTEAIVDSE